MTRSYDFECQLRSGERRETELDQIFQRISSYEIFAATSVEQRQGIDRWFAAPGKRFAVQYKADSKAGRTGNGFVETVSVDVPYKQGWAITTQAEYLAYWNVLNAVIYWIPLSQIRANLARWSVYPSRAVPNQRDDLRWNTIGLLVPLCEFECAAEEVINL